MEIGYFADTADTLEGRCLLNEGCNLLIQLRDAEYLCCTLSQLLGSVSVESAIHIFYILDRSLKKDIFAIWRSTSSYRFYFHLAMMAFRFRWALDWRMSNSGSDTSSVETSSRGAVILDESDPRTVIERLPNTVFPGHDSVCSPEIDEW